MSSLGILILLPVFILVAVLIALESNGPVLYKQVRVGKGNKDFKILKFRTMKVNSDKQGLLTVGGRDPRITRIGYFLRKFKIDELPQLINVFMGEMSFVGPRPEVRKYVSLYTKDQLKVLDVQPGITDQASILYSNENEILSTQDNPDAYYISVIMPNKLKINLSYIKQRSFMKDIGVILKTIFKILR